MIPFNVVPTVFHIDHISPSVCKTVRTTFQCIVVLKLREKVLYSIEIWWTQDLRVQLKCSCIATLISSKCSSDSFPHTVRYVVGTTLKCINVLQSRGECPKYIAMKFGGLRISECNLNVVVLQV